MSLVLFRCDIFGNCSPFETLNQYQQPKESIPENITLLTGITNEMVAGHRISWGEIELLLNDSELVIAHNAKFDRPFVDKYLDDPDAIDWACTLAEIPWENAPGFSSRSLEFVLYKYGWFYGSHRADVDCFAGVQLLNEEFPGSGKKNIEILIENSSNSQIRVCAHKAPFHAKDKLKDRGYSWEPCDNEGQKYWFKDVLTGDEFEDEAKWLSQFPHTLLIGHISASNRFSGRIKINAVAKVKGAKHA